MSDTRESGRDPFEAAGQQTERAGWIHTLEPQPMSVEAITRNPWVAVHGAIPEAPSDELLAVARAAAARCAEESLQEFMRSTDGESHGLDQDYQAARQRGGEIDAIARAREAARESMTIEAIRHDPWNAVLRDLPVNGTHELYAAASDAAGRLLYGTPENELTVPAALAYLEPPEIGDMLKTRWQEAATAAHDVLVHEAWQAPEFSHDTVAADRWTAVYLPIPARADPDLLAEARRLAEVCRNLISDQGPDYGPAVPQGYDGPEQNSQRATERMAELAGRLIEVEHAAEARPEIGTRTPPSGMLSPEFAARSVSSHAARAMEIALDTIMSILVPDPKLTPQQAHDLARADAERAEVRAFEGAAYERAAALDAANHQIDHNRSPVHEGAGDEVRRGESIYDRYPGLTRDIESNHEREREEDRAFYDTGIERAS